MHAKFFDVQQGRVVLTHPDDFVNEFAKVRSEYFDMEQRNLTQLQDSEGISTTASTPRSAPSSEAQSPLPSPPINEIIAEGGGPPGMGGYGGGATPPGDMRLGKPSWGGPGEPARLITVHCPLRS